MRYNICEVITMSEFNINLKKVREGKRLTAKELAIDLGIPYTTYIKYEWNGEPRYDTLIKIADYLNVSIDKLLGHSVDEYEYYKQWLTSLEGIEVYINSDNQIMIDLPMEYDNEHTNLRLTVSDKTNFISLAKCILKQNSSNLKKYERDLTLSALRFIHLVGLSPLDELKKVVLDKWNIDVKADYAIKGLLSLGLKFPEANKKNPSPSESEGLKG